jgi:hypothetical protein
VWVVDDSNNDCIACLARQRYGDLDVRLISHAIIEALAKPYIRAWWRYSDGRATPMPSS